MTDRESPEQCPEAAPRVRHPMDLVLAVPPRNARRSRERRDEGRRGLRKTRRFMGPSDDGRHRTAVRGSYVTHRVEAPDSPCRELRLVLPRSFTSPPALVTLFLAYEACMYRKRPKCQTSKSYKSPMPYEGRRDAQVRRNNAAPLPVVVLEHENMAQRHWGRKKERRRFR